MAVRSGGVGFDRYRGAFGMGVVDLMLVRHLRYVVEAALVAVSIVMLSISMWKESLVRMEREGLRLDAKHCFDKMRDVNENLKRCEAACRR